MFMFMMVVFFVVARNVSHLFPSLGMVLTITVMVVLMRALVINSQVNLYFSGISVNFWIKTRLWTQICEQKFENNNKTFFV